MSKKKKIIISILSLVLCVLVSFAWINELQNPAGRVMALRFTNASTGDSKLEVSLSVNINEDDSDEKDVFEAITKYCVEGAEPDLETYEDFAPGARKKFKVDIKNIGDAPVRLRLILSDIICEDEDLRDNIVIGTNGFDGFDTNYPAPPVLTKRLSDGMDATGNFTLVDLVEIPPQTPVSIYFYVMFTSTGSANLENMTFSIGKLNFLTI